MENIKETFDKLASSVPQSTKRNVDAKQKFVSETDELIDAFAKIGECTAKSYNRDFYPLLRRARSFVSCLDDALQKAGDDTIRQCQIIGWDEQTKYFLLAAIECYDREIRMNVDMKG